MAVFLYNAKDKDGKLIRGVLEVEDESIARSLLNEQGLIILSLEQKKTFNFQFFSKYITKKDIVIFSRQLAVMVSAHIPIVRALHIIAKQTQNQRLKNIIKKVYTQVASGNKLSDALNEHKKVFNGFYVNMIKSGETSGKLADVLNYLSDQLEKEYNLYRKVKGAITYPIVVIVAMIIAAFIVLIYVIPKLVMVFQTMNVKIPWTTNLLISFSDFIINFWWIILFGGFLIILIIRTYLSTYVGKLFLSKLKLKIPVFGKLFSSIYVLQFSRSLYTLLSGGIDLVDSLNIVKDVVQDPQYQLAINDIIVKVRDGNSLSNEIAKQKLFPDIVGNMIVVGEQSGKLVYMLEKLSDYYESEIDTLTTNIMALIEPLVMILLGIGVALMVSAVFLPLYTIPSL